MSIPVHSIKQCYKLYKTLYVKNNDNRIEIFDPDTCQVRRIIQFTTTPDIVHFFPSGEVLLVADYNRVKICSVSTGQIVSLIQLAHT